MRYCHVSIQLPFAFAMDSKYSTLKYANSVFWFDVILAFYWICALIYITIEDHEHLLKCIIFGFHYIGLLTLTSIIDEHQTKLANVNQNDTDQDELYAPSHFPRTWVMALFLAGITDIFSMIDIALDYHNNIVPANTFYVLIVLFALGTFITIMTFVWVTIYFVYMQNNYKNVRSGVGYNERYNDNCTPYATKRTNLVRV